MKSTAYALLPFSLLIIAVPASADARSFEDDAPRVVVRHHDLNLTDAGDVERLNRRVRNASKSVCPKPTLSLRESMLARKCQNSAAARAAEQVEVAIADAHARNPRLASAARDKSVSDQ